MAAPRVASPLQRWYTRDDPRAASHDERTQFGSPQQHPQHHHQHHQQHQQHQQQPHDSPAYAAFNSSSFSSSRPALSNLRLDSDPSTPYANRRPHPPRTAHSMDTIPSATTTFADEFRSQDSLYSQPAPGAPASFPSSSDASMSMEWAPQYHPYSPPTSYIQPRTDQRYPSSRNDPSSPTSPPAHPTTSAPTSVIDPALQEGSTPSIWVPSGSYPSTQSNPKPSSSMSHDELVAEVNRLRQRVSELEIGIHWSELKTMKLEAEAQTLSRNGSSSGSSGAASPPAMDRVSAVMGGIAPTEDISSSWRRRTDARTKRFCALNRAGNALCAWHDSRRERRAYPPRQAPPGYLNCGCTNDEALFEESLARHGVGSYHPGEMVRMDPALRNPLLKLLEARFGYVDGDFERDGRSGHWLEGEGHELWETLMPAGKPAVGGNSRRREGKSQ